MSNLVNPGHAACLQWYRGAIIEWQLVIILKTSWPEHLGYLNPLLLKLCREFSKELMHNDLKQGKVILHDGIFGSVGNSIIWILWPQYSESEYSDRSAS